MSDEEHEARLKKAFATIEELLRKGTERAKFKPNWINQLSTTQPHADDMFKYPAGLRERGKAMLRELEAVRRRIEGMSQPDEAP